MENMHNDVRVLRVEAAPVTFVVKSKPNSSKSITENNGKHHKQPMRSRSRNKQTTWSAQKRNKLRRSWSSFEPDSFRGW